MASEALTPPEAAARWLHAHFDPEAARGVVAVIEMELTGPGGGTVCLQIEDGRIKTRVGGDVAPHVRFALSVDDWAALTAGRANAELLAMEERIAISGDHALAMRMRALFPRRSRAAG